MESIHHILRSYFGFSAFRGRQEDVIQSILAGNNTLAIMPTGGGKSICYQVPALAMPGTCLVISPLIALMKDQVEGLRKKNITAFAIYSGMSYKEVHNTLRLATESNCKFLFVSPERLETSLFLEYLPGIAINLIAVDEAHCISQWGYDFRPPYLRIAAIRDEIQQVPILALTASATPIVQQDICQKLSLSHFIEGDTTQENWNVFKQSFSRPNLAYHIVEADNRSAKVIEIIKEQKGSSIVYCRSRRRTQDIAELLQLNGVTADYYHAGLSALDRSMKQEMWMEDKVQIIVCTNAFGMGIDKPNVRCVIHVDEPDCLENYYQEAGRAGRDGQPSTAHLLYTKYGLEKIEMQMEGRFPSIDTIRRIYQSIANYLQLPAGAGSGEYVDFDLPVFAKTFKYDIFEAYYCLQALEQNDWVSFNEQVFLTATLQFNINKEGLYEFETNNSSLAPLIKTLLRSYEGIFDYPTFISETLLARLLKTDIESIKKQLAMLHRHGIVLYAPQKEKPQLFFNTARVAAQDLYIDEQAFNKRKEATLRRTRLFIKFMLAQDMCRSVMIGKYFGDLEIKPCGICDNCIKLIPKEVLPYISSVEITSRLQVGSIQVKKLLHSFAKENHAQVLELLHHLQDEGIIEADKLGNIFLKKKS